MVTGAWCLLSSAMHKPWRDANARVMMHPMNKLNPRINATLTPAAAAVLRELSELTGNSQSSIVGDLLESAVPVFSRVCTALRAAAEINASAKTEIAAGLERAQTKLEGQLGLMLGDMDDTLAPLLQQAEKIARRGAATVGAAPRRSGSPPVAVTRGVGQPGRRATAAKSGRPESKDQPRKRARS
jgi:hypothetical protein